MQSEWRDVAGACFFEFPDARNIDEEQGDLICVGADLQDSTLIYAYSHGLFPMHIRDDESDDKTLGWFSPVSRAIFPLDSLRITRSMRKSAKKYECRHDTCFEKMMRMCMTVPRHSGWIDEEFIAAYRDLHEQGLAHSVEVFEGEELVGGLYGVGFAGFFAGESMVHTKRDASKVALIYLVDVLNEHEATLLDAQWMTPHLYSLGAQSVPRTHYFHLLEQSLKVPSRSWSV